MASPGSSSRLGQPRGPSTCCLLYLFADQLVAHSTILSHLDAQHGVRLPCHKAAVQLGPLERLIFAWAFWHLRERGLIELGYLDDIEEEDPDDATPPDRDIVVRRVGNVTGVYGLEAEVLKASRPEDELIGAVLRRWAGEHIPLPLYAVVRSLHDEAASYGLVQLKEHEAGQDPFTDHRLAHFASEDCEQIAGLEPRFAALLTGWKAFEAQRTEAAADLVDRCRLGLLDLRPPPTMAMGSQPIH